MPPWCFLGPYEHKCIHLCSYFKELEMWPPRAVQLYPIMSYFSQFSVLDFPFGGLLVSVQKSMYGLLQIFFLKFFSCSSCIPSFSTNSSSLLECPLVMKLLWSCRGKAVLVWKELWGVWDFSLLQIVTFCWCELTSGARAFAQTILHHQISCVQGLGENGAAWLKGM